MPAAAPCETLRPAMASVWLRDARTGRAGPRAVPCGARVRDLLPPRAQGYPVEDFYVKCNGRLVGADVELEDGLVYSLEPRLHGGKGGFGSMLRALGAQIEKTTNREACRDLSGRRLRDVNHENAMADWLKQQAEREAEKEQRRLERLQRKLAEPKHYFTNLEYQKQCNEMSERLEDSVLKGMQASSSSVVLPEASDSRKRPNESETRTKSGKKKCFWMGVEGVEGSGSSDSSEDDESSSTSGVSGQSNETPSKRIEVTNRGGSSSEESEDDLPSDALEKPLDHIGDCSKVLPSDMINIAYQDTHVQTDKDKYVDVEIPLTDEGVNEATEECCRSEETKRCDLPAESTEKRQEQTTDFGKDLPCDMMVVESLGPDVLAGMPELEKDGDTKAAEERVQENSIVPDIDNNLPLRSDPSPVDLMTFTSAAALESLGLEILKQELMVRALKCGGTLQERAVRLFSVRGLAKDQIDPALFAKPLKGKRK